MSFFFGGKGQKAKPQFTGLSTQTSTSALAITILLGMNRCAPNIIWQGDFKATKKKQKAGKGGGSVEYYEYSGSYIMALCWGRIAAVTRVWKDQSKENSYSALGMTLFNGDTPQAPWGYMTSKHPDQALGYPGIAYLCVANYQLGQSNSLPQHSFLTQGPLWQTGYRKDGIGPDADPALAVEAFLTDESFGLGFNMSVIDDASFFSGPDANVTGDSAFQTYCRAMGFSLSPSLQTQSQAGEIVERWADLCNTALVWTGYCLKFHPRGADVVENNGVKYLPNFPVRYNLTDKDFIPRGKDPITFDRTDPADCWNSFSIIIANSENEYNDLPVPWKDQGLIDQFGLRKRDNQDCKEITDPHMASIMVALMGQRAAYIRNTYTFALPVRFCRLEPMDVLVCNDPRLGSFAVLITEVTESDDDTFDITAEEWHGSVTSVPPANGSQVVDNTPIDTLVVPGPVNPPIIFEPPSSLAGSIPQVWAAVSGGDGTSSNPNWGGANVWLSTDDITYNQIGQLEGARMGKLTANLPNFPTGNPDAVNTLKVSLLMSDGELSDATSASDAEAGVTRSYVDGEIISYQTVNLTGVNAYDLDDLWRGQYGTTRGAHANGTKFARLDDNIFRYDLPAQYVGVPLYLKFQSFNIFGQQAQDLADCVAYEYTPTGAGGGTGVDGKPAQVTGVGGSTGSSFTKLTWTANPVNDNVSAYKIFRAAGTGQPFGSAVVVGTVTGAAVEWTDASVTPTTGYSYYVVASNTFGDGPQSARVDLTTAGGGGGTTLWNVFATGTGASQNVTLPYSNPNEIGVFVYVNGVRYETDEYSISGTTLTLTTNASGDSIEIVGVTS